MSVASPAESRRARGLAIASVCKITERDGAYHVPSQTGNGAYRVKLGPADPTCTCADFSERGQPCKHVFAVRFATGLEPMPEGAPAVLPGPDVAKQTRAPRPTYKQNWPAYDATQVHEKAKLQALLADLCRAIPEPPRGEKGGRPPIPMADRVFAAALKVYTTISGRRASSDVRDAQAKGHLSRAPHFSRVSRFMEDPAMTPILRGLIAESARPLASVEVDFAVDSSGFTTSRFVRWFDAKYGKPMQEYDWVKCSLITGVRTNIVAAVEIDERYAGDCPKFAPLVNATAARFTIREVSADKAYASYDNYELVASHGGTAYIAFPSNTTAAKGGIYAKMFHYFNLRRDEFLSHYHKRSNVESTFSMIKAKFGDHLRSRTDAAMVNEALCKILCHNICVLIQSHYELGIDPVFWGEDAKVEAKAREGPVAKTEGDGEPGECWDWV